MPMRRLMWIFMVVVASLFAPGVRAQTCDACGKRVDSLEKPVKLAGTWLFTRDDKADNALPNQDTGSWKTVKAPGPWKKIYDDKQVFEVGWYRGSLEFAPNLIGQEVVLLVNTYMAKMQVYANGELVYARPRNENIERFYSTQAVPVRFKVTQSSMVIAIRVDTPLMTGIYQLPLELHAYNPHDASLVAWAVWGGELRTSVGWSAFFFGLFFLLVYRKTRYSLYLVALLGSFFGWQFLVTPADYLAALVPIRTLTYLHYTGVCGAFFFFLFSQYFHKFVPKTSIAAGLMVGIPALGMASMAIHENLHVFQVFRTLFFVMVLFPCFLGIYFFFRGALQKKSGAKTMLVGMLVFTFGSLHDSLLGLGLIQSVALAPSALMGCLGAMLFVSIQTFANTFVENKRLVRDLRDINENLEGLVAQRTQALREKTNDIQAMLQNMPQGVATVVADSRIHPEYSAYLETIFETKEVAGRPAMDLLFGRAQLGSDARDQVSVAMASTLGEDRMNYDFNSHLLVGEADIKLADGRVKSLELSWSPICAEDDTVEKLMVCVRDVTELKRLSAESAGQRRELALIGEILAVSQEKFQSFIESAQAFLQENRTTIEAQTGRKLEAINLLFRNMHTIKGNARTYGLLHLTNTVHEAEQDYDDLRKHEDAVWNRAALLTRLDHVELQVSEYARINSQTLGRKGPGRRGAVEKFLMIDRLQLSNAIGQLQRADRNSLEGMRDALAQAERALRHIGTDTLKEALSTLIDGLEPLARELGKEPPNVVIEDQGLRVKAQLSALLRNLFTHLLRNALDHGLEPAAERMAKGKAPRGSIVLSASQSAEHFEIRVRDDGRGLALVRIRQRARELGLVAAGQVMNDTEAAELIFLPGFSTAEQVTEVSGRGVGMDAVRDFLSREEGNVSLRLISGKEGDAFRQAELLLQLPAAASTKA
jgi:HPt (histidine-containing phosphotransfer) domain-containing protein/PAS domain-containing protein/two-component sensor histidine kinase